MLDIIEFFTSYDAAWNEHSAEAFTGHFLENASAHFLMLDGKKKALNSRADILEFYIASFQALHSRPTVAHQTEINREQNITPDLALADCDVLITETGADGKMMILRKWAVSFLLVTTDAGYRVLFLRAFERPLS